MTEEKKYLEWTEGKNKAFVKDLTWSRNAKNEVELKLLFGDSNAPDALHTTITLRPTSKAGDSQYLKMMKDKEVQTALLPLADIEVKEGVVLKLSEIVLAAKANLEQADIQVEVDIKQSEGKVDSRTGESRVFSNIVGLVVIEAFAKVPYESKFEVDLDDLPF
jgi:hypothetical protein